ncbi:hypothetical protein KI387_009639, partial [Taxus chinensis]
ERTSRQRILADRYDVDAWFDLASEAQLRPVSVAVAIFEQLLAVFPTAAKYWRLYVEAQMATNNDDATRQIFSRCLLSCRQVDLWKCYIRFIQKVNESRGTDGRDEIKKAFEFTLQHIGTDIASGPIWMEYIAFLKSLPAATLQEESQRMTTMRKAYQTAILIPTHHVEQLWKDYESFENAVSRALAKGLLSEYQPKYISARAVYRERKKICEEIDENKLAVPPSGSLKEEQQCSAWRRLLAFEIGNPQRIDSVTSASRVALTYEQCLMYLYHYPDIWYGYATWRADNGSKSSANEIFQRALQALPDSEVLWYAYAELEESRGRVQRAKEIYDKLLRNSSTAMALGNIQFLRFIRRTEGHEAARKFFSEARKSPSCTYHLYVTFAMMAFCLDKEPKVAQHVFEAGLKRFMLEPAYILEYADFLCRLNDDKNIRALFERALSLLPPEESTEVWDRFIRFEQTYGDLASILKVEQRRKEALSRTGGEVSESIEGSLEDVVSRYSFMDLWPCSSRELDHLARQKWLAKAYNDKHEKSFVMQTNGLPGLEKSTFGQGDTMRPHTSSKIIRPDLSQMNIYDPRQKPGAYYLNSSVPGLTPICGSLPQNSIVGAASKSFDDSLRYVKPPLASFIIHLPAVNGPSPEADAVISVLLQSDIPSGFLVSTGCLSQPSSSFLEFSSIGQVSSFSKGRPILNGSILRSSKTSHPLKRKEIKRQEEDETATVNQPLQKDIFRVRQIQRARALSTSQAGSTSGGSGTLAGEPS